MQMSVNALKMDSVFPVTVTILSGQLPSLMLIFADERECLEDGFCVPSHRHDSLWAAPVADVDLRSTLFSKSLDYVSLLPYNASHFFSLHDQADGKGDIGAVCGRQCV